MGDSLSCAAVKGGKLADVLMALKLHPTAANEDFPESPIVGAALPNGWYLIISQRDGLRLLVEAAAGSLSQLGETVICFVAE